MVHLINAEICKCVFRQVNVQNTGQVASQLPPFAVPGNSGRLSQKKWHLLELHHSVNNVCSVSPPHYSETDTG